MRYSWLFALFVLSTGSLCPLAELLQPHWGDFRVKHAWDAVPPKWERLGHPPTGIVIDLYFALKPQNEDALIDALLEVSDPDHSRYRAYLSREQVSGLVAPHPKTLELINSWLEHHGVPSSSVSTSHGGGWLTVTGVSVSQANALLGTSYQLFQHSETKHRVLRTLGYSLPAILHGHVQTVAPTTFFGSPRTSRKTPRNRSGGEASGEPAKVLSSRAINDIAPSYLRWRYNVRTYVPAATARNVLALVGYIGEYPSQEDLTVFMNQYRSDGEDATFNLVHVGEQNLPGQASSESNLEIQYTQAITFPTPHIYYTVDEPNFLTWLHYMSTIPRTPPTITTSWGDDEQDFALDYARALCILFAALGLRGASVITASGDDGVGRGDCRANDGSGTVHFLPKFPASCPWITSVGGTMVFSNSRSTIYESDEVAASHSSGGFSNYFKRPPYQATAVPTFFERFRNRHAGLYNISSRGFPDISAQAENYQVIFRGAVENQWGTGCAASVVAGVISLLNDYLISQNEEPLGFLNTWLYRRGWEGFEDITAGANPGCGVDGFWAVRGWDPVTGFGTPDFRKMVEILATQPRYDPD